MAIKKKDMIEATIEAFSICGEKQLLDDVTKGVNRSKT
jgi:hypothetical protein